MSMTDPVADLLTRIRNAAREGHEKLDVPASRLKANVVRVLKEEGYIRNFRLQRVEGKPVIKVYLKYTTDGKSVIQGLRRISRPGLRRYSGYDGMPRPLSGAGVSIVSTSRGVMTGNRARAEKSAARFFARYGDMSRVGKLPIKIPSGVKVEIKGSDLKVEGPKGKLNHRVPRGVSVEAKDGQVIVTRDDNLVPNAAALHGLTRTLVYNMVQGVHAGFERKLEIVGVGYRAQAKGSTLTLNVGYSHPIDYKLPEGIQAKVEANTKLTVSGADKVLVGMVAAKIRSFRKPEPYQGKGIKYADERIIRKQGKAAAK